MSAWPTVLLGEVCTVVGGGTPTRTNPEYYGSEIPWVTPKDMKRWNIAESQVSLTKLGLEKSAARLVPEGSVLIVVRSGVLKHTLPVGLARVQVAINQDMKALLCNPAVDPDYLARYIKSRSNVILKWVRATTADNFSIDKLKQLRVPLPPISEQRRIAAILDHVDALRAKRREALAQLKEVTQAIFVDMFGDLGAGQTLWPETSLADLLLGIDSGKSPVCLTRSANLDEYGVLKLSAVTTGVFDQNQNKALPEDAVPDVRHEVEGGDLLFTRKNTGVLVAASAVVRQVRPKLLIPDLIFRLRIDPNRQIEALYLQAAMMHPPVRKRIQGLAGGSAGSMPNISKAKLRTVALPHPPRTLQVEFGERVEHIELLKSHNRSALAELDSLFASLQSQAFQGEL
ncbi:restriction endonuclease subunit S [Rhodococcus qingshengii]|uniref:restriction endonuclease subunit S n=1 Tax=Rhodococcus qingshengii TaxID=334542 RepID=UPI0037CBD1C9